VIRQLNPGGRLMSGHSESLANLDVPLRTVQTAVYTQA
jgi:chemotaxis methyl-accepting protein methylase